MKIKASWLASGVVVGSLLIFAGSQGCSSDDSSDAPAGTSHKGEACQKTSDCVGGLACVPNTSGNGGTCVVGLFNVAQTNKECAVIECSVPKDCCATQSANCTELQQECAQETDAGFGTTNGSCSSYKSLCVCDETLRDCESGQCVVKCADDQSCLTSGAGSKCLGGKCGQCSIDTDCTSFDPTFTCVNAKCQPPCQGDGDCSGFDRCVSGKCIDGGCQSTRECVAATRNVESTCGTDGKCIVPCQTDLECGNPKGYDFYSCIAGRCQYVGCEDDKDCRLLLLGDTGDDDTTTTSSSGFTSSSSSSGGLTSVSSKTHIVCQVKTTPTTATIPAQR